MSAALITGRQRRQGRRSIYRDRVFTESPVSCGVSELLCGPFAMFLQSFAVFRSSFAVLCGPLRCLVLPVQIYYSAYNKAAVLEKN